MECWINNSTLLASTFFFIFFHAVARCLAMSISLKKVGTKSYQEGFSMMPTLQMILIHGKEHMVYGIHVCICK
jgi:hypothetical protein